MEVLETEILQTDVNTNLTLEVAVTETSLVDTSVVVAVEPETYSLVNDSMYKTNLAWLEETIQNSLIDVYKKIQELLDIISRLDTNITGDITDIIKDIDIISTTGIGDLLATIEDLRNRISQLEAGVHQSITSINNEIISFNSLETAIISRLDGNEAAIYELLTTKVDKNSASAIASRIISSTFGGNADTYIANIARTYTDANSAIAQAINRLYASYNDVEVSITALDEVVVKKAAVYTQPNDPSLDPSITLEIGDYWVDTDHPTRQGYQWSGAGWNLASDDAISKAVMWSASSSKLITDPEGNITGWAMSDSSTTESDFTIYAENFKVTNGHTGHTPFSIVGSDIQFNGTVSINKTQGSIFIGAYSSAPSTASVVIGGVTYTLKDGDTYKNTTDGIVYYKSGASWLSTAGKAAKLITLTTTAETFATSVTGAVSPSTITVTGVVQETTITTWEYSVDGGAFSATVPTGVSRTGNVVTLTGSNTVNTTISIKASDATVSDTLTIVKLANGTDSITVVVSNESHTIPTDSSGNKGTYTGSGTNVRVYEGATELTYDGSGTSAGMWNATLTATSVTAGSKTDNGTYLTIGDSSNMTANTASISIAVSGKRQNGTSFNVTKIQSLAKSLEGAPGKGQVKGICFLRASSAPATPTGGSYLSPTATGWSDGIPAGTLPLYMTTRIFTSDGLTPQQSAWTTPQLTSALGQGTKVQFSVDGSSTSWHDTPGVSDVYMRTGTSTDGGATWAYAGAVKIKGEAGEDGTDGTNGTNGVRGAISAFATYTTLTPSASELAATINIIANPDGCMVGDNVTYTVSGTSGGTKMAYCTAAGNPGSWVNNVALYVNGDAIITGTLAADKLQATAISGQKMLIDSSTNPKASTSNGGTLALINSAQGVNFNALAGVNKGYSGGHGVWGENYNGVSSYFGAGVGGRGGTGGIFYGMTHYGVNGQGATHDFYASGVGMNFGPFTGSHDAFILDTATAVPGDILSMKKILFTYGISQTSGEVVLSTASKDVNVFGVYNMKMELFDAIGSMAPDIDLTILHNLDYIGVNSIGEGMINVCSENGNILSGDYICSSNIPGKGMKQDDDILHNYTVAKAMESVDWNLEQSTTKMIACTYHCG